MNTNLILIIIIFIFFFKKDIENFATKKGCNRCMRKNMKRFRNFSRAKDVCIANDLCDTNLAHSAKFRRRRRNKKIRKNIYWNAYSPYNMYKPHLIQPYNIYPKVIYNNGYIIPYNYDYNMYDCVQCINSIDANYLDFNQKYRLCSSVGRCDMYR